MVFTVLLYYHFVPIENPEELVTQQRALCEKLELKGRILIGEEGINGTVAGLPEQIEAYKQGVWEDPRFTTMVFKESKAETMPFPKLKIKLRPEIISLHQEVRVKHAADSYRTPEQLHALYESGEEFYLLDARNKYESDEGGFKGAVLPAINHFRELPKILDSIKDLRDKKIVTYCTGGIRCEKASALLQEYGFDKVYQLEGGIVSYIMQYPDTYFEGDCYVFDDRMRLTQQEIAKNGAISQAPQCLVPQSLVLE